MRLYFLTKSFLVSRYKRTTFCYIGWYKIYSSNWICISFSSLQMLPSHCWLRLIRFTTLHAQLLQFSTNTILWRWVLVFLQCFLKYFLPVPWFLLYISIDYKDKCHWHTEHAGTCQASGSKVRDVFLINLLIFPSLMALLNWDFMEQDLAHINFRGIWRSSYPSTTWNILG